MLITLQIPPGVYKNGTEYQSKGRWQDCDLIRWFEGSMRPIGGWSKLRYTDGLGVRQDLQVMGTARGSHAWRDNATEFRLAIGTNTNLYVRTGTIGNVTDITPAGLVTGFEDTQINFGYGGGLYGVEAYGTMRSEVNFGDLANTWSMDNFGEFLLAVSSADGKLYYWDLLTPTATEVIAVSGITPLDNIGVLVTDERFVFLLAAGGNPRRVAWSDQEDLFNWEVTATTQAGDFELKTAGDIVQALRVRGQTLILTTEDAHVANYIGPPLVYGFERVGTGCGCISNNAAVSVNTQAMWMGNQSFYMYDGFVKPIPCDVQDFVFSNLNLSQAAKIWGTHNADFGEVTWFYPQSNEIDSYVTYNYREGHWAVGSMSRTTGVDNSVFQSPIRVTPNGLLYRHEVGFTYDLQFPYAESGPIELGQGEQIYMAKYLYPDEKTQGQVQARFGTKFYPNATEYPFGPYQMANPTSIRFTGRQVAMRVEGIVNEDWRVGVPRMDVELGGLR